MEISEFQKLMKELFFHQDQKRGILATFSWLVEEIGELARTLRQKELNKAEISDEMADIFAWLSSLANLLDIDLEEACYKKYPHKCLKCNSNPCKCGI
jgi:NTP pyrophosphatase (non-canonical NTP hydrolase)